MLLVYRVVDAGDAPGLRPLSDNISAGCESFMFVELLPHERVPPDHNQSLFTAWQKL